VPELIRPTVVVRESYLAGERAMAAEEGKSPDWLPVAEAAFAAFAARRAVTQHYWDVDVTELWFVDGAGYLGTVMIRHALTPQLRAEGGHIGYHVVPQHRRRGHATAMLAGACAWCRGLGLTEVLVTCDENNTGSRRVIEANGGELADVAGGTCRYWIAL
jgi:predicted acetyltransferase